jgi:hypothetical protein
MQVGGIDSAANWIHVSPQPRKFAAAAEQEMNAAY